MALPLLARQSLQFMQIARGTKWLTVGCIITAVIVIGAATNSGLKTLISSFRGPDTAGIPVTHVATSDEPGGDIESDDWIRIPLDDFTIEIPRSLILDGTITKHDRIDMIVFQHAELRVSVQLSQDNSNARDKLFATVKAETGRDVRSTVDLMADVYRASSSEPPNEASGPNNRYWRWCIAYSLGPRVPFVRSVDVFASESTEGMILHGSNPNRWVCDCYSADNSRFVELYVDGVTSIGDASARRICTSVRSDRIRSRGQEREQDVNDVVTRLEELSNSLRARRESN